MVVKGATMGMCFNQACETLRTSGLNLINDENQAKLKALTKKLYKLVNEIESELNDEGVSPEVLALRAKAQRGAK